MKKRNPKLLISNLLCLILATLFLTPAHGAREETFSATLVDFGGEASIQKPDEEIWLPVEKDIPLEQGDRLKTGEDSYIEILIDDGSLLKVEENSEITLREISFNSVTKKISSTMKLWVGRLLSNIVKFTHRKSRFEVRTPTVVAGVRGTEFIIETTDSKQTDVGVFEGEVAVGGVDKEERLIKESEVLITKGNQTSVLKNRRPLHPFPLKKKMLSHKKRLDVLKKKAIEKRRNLKKIIEKRAKTRKQILKRWKDIRQEKLKKTIRSKEKIKEQKLKKIKRPKKTIKRR